MASSTTKTFWRGARDGAPFVLVIVPFSALFGVVATEAGLDLAQVMGFSVLVIAGASQFAAVQLIEDGAPTLAVLATSLAVNLRMAMYSAALTPHLGKARLWQRVLIAYLNVDQSYALASMAYERQPEMPLREKLAYFFGVVTPVFPLWYAGTFVGAIAGSSMPDGYALDFAVPITFLALIAPALKTLAHLAAAVTSVVLSLALAGLPSGTGLLLAAGCAMTVGALVEAWRERSAAWS